uniref:Charged multivesicular body protein 3 n=1 Tax=Oryctolagus cuniculus TaxID=9986 RepID=A0A5F9CZ24_RABIT
MKNPINREIHVFLKTVVYKGQDEFRSPWGCLGKARRSRPKSCGPARGWFPAEEHRGDEGHAEPCEDPRDPGHHEGAVQEMMKAGITEEMLEDTFESMDDQEEMEEAAEMEIDRILLETTAGALGKAPSKVTDALPEPELPGAMAASEDDEEEEALEAMQLLLATLRS